MKTYTKKIITSALLLTLVISANASNHKHHAGVIFGSVNMHKHESSFVGFEYQHNISAQFAVGITSEKMNGYDPKDSISVNTLSAFWYPIPHLKLGIGIGEEKVTGKHNYKASVGRGTISYEYPVDKISIAPTLTIDSIDAHTVTAFGIAFQWDSNVMKTNDIHQIIYVSKATSRFSSEQLISLLKTARRNNSVSNITGLLLYNGVGTFLQVIEGPESALTSLMSKIKADKRHVRIDTLFRGSVNGRYFPDWKMGFRDLSKHSPITIEGFSDFMEENNTLQFINDDPVFAFRLVNHFKNNQYRGAAA